MDMGMSDLLIQQYGVLLTVEQLATVFQVSPAAMRQALRRGNGFGGDLRQIAHKRGRRLYFPAPGVAKVIEGARVE